MSTVRPSHPPKALSRQAPDVVREYSTTATDPRALYARLRAECPVALQEGTRGSSGGTKPAWLITRHADIMAACNDPDTFGQSVRFEGQRRPPLESNPPEHRTWRRLLQPFFTPKAIAQFAPVSREIASKLIGPLIDAGRGDFAAGVARPLPPQVLLALLRQPQEDWSAIKEASEAMYFQGSSQPEERARYEAADAFLWSYARQAVEARKTTPQDPSADLIAAMLEGAKQGGEITEPLIAGVIRLFLGAGHDSTTSAVSICAEYVAEDQALQRKLREEPALIPAAIEEILRLRPPVLQMPRTVMKDVTLHGRTLEEGDAALLVYASGNLDEDAFPDATSFKLRSPNRHLSFGFGVHTCLGNSLARLEMRVTLEQLLSRTKSFRLSGAADHEFWHPFGSTALPLVFEI